jgi:tyrosine-protein kinase Etk/Wzc
VLIQNRRSYSQPALFFLKFDEAIDFFPTTTIRKAKSEQAMKMTFPSSPQPMAQPTDEVSLSRYLDVLHASRRLVLTIAVLVFCLGALYALLAPPVYKADLLVQVEDNVSNPNSKGPLGDVSNLFQVKPEATGEMGILQSRLVVSAAVDNLKLYLSATPKRFPIIGDWIANDAKHLSQPGLFGRGGYTWGDESIKVSRFDVPDELEGKKFTLVAIGGGRFQLNRPDVTTPSQGKVGETNVFDGPDGPITLHVDSIAGNPGAEFVLVRNSREKTIEELQGKLEITQRGKDSGIIGASINGPNRYMTPRILNEIGDAYVSQNIDRKAAEAEKSLAFLNDLLPKLKSDLDQAELRYNEMRDQYGMFNLSDEAKTNLEQTVAAQRTILDLKQKRDDLVTHYTREHPNVQAIDRQIGTLNEKLASLAQTSKMLPVLEQNAVRLTRDVQVKSDLYTGMLNNVQQLKVVRAGKVGSVRLLDHAVVPKDPIRPNRLVILVASAVVGLFLGMVAAFVRWAVRGGVSDPNEIEQRTGLDVFATVPLATVRATRPGALKHRASSLAPLLASEAPGDPSIESLRGLRAALHFSMLETGNNRVMLTGPTDGVGKSFVSSNLAALISSAGKRVLLIDADLRKGHLDEYFGGSNAPGLSDYLQGTVSFDMLVRQQVMPGLDFIPRGSGTSNPAELLLSTRMNELLELGERYDIVLIDTPPVLAVSDATALAYRCGTVFLVARSELTSIVDVTEATKQLRQANAEIKGVIFNGFDTGAYHYSAGPGRRRYSSYLSNVGSGNGSPVVQDNQ